MVASGYGEPSEPLAIPGHGGWPPRAGVGVGLGGDQRSPQPLSRMVRRQQTGRGRVARDPRWPLGLETSCGDLCRDRSRGHRSGFLQVRLVQGVRQVRPSLRPNSARLALDRESLHPTGQSNAGPRRGAVAMPDGNAGPPPMRRDGRDVGPAPHLAPPGSTLATAASRPGQSGQGEAGRATSSGDRRLVVVCLAYALPCAEVQQIRIGGVSRVCR
jgi:hypothetical protein